MPPKSAPVYKKREEFSTTSIRDALNGKVVEEEKDDAIPAEYTAKTNVVDEFFTQSQLEEAWKEFAEKYSGQVHLYHTLSNKPELLDKFKVKITVENSVQNDQIRLLKPEMIGFLTRRLMNSLIDVKIEMMDETPENKLLTDDQKLQAMMKKNPSLFKMRNLFNLDFNG